MATRHEGVWRSEYTGPHILGLGTRQRLVVGFTPRPLCPRGKELLAPIKQGAGRTRDYPKILEKRTICCSYQESNFDSSPV